MSWQEAAKSHSGLSQSVDRAFWAEYLAQRPDVLHHLLEDVWKVVADDPKGVPSVDELYDMVTPKFSTKPFTEAVWELLGDRSVRWLAMKMGIHHSQVARFLNADRDVQGVRERDPADRMARIEAFARALSVHPSYFAEWRRLWIIAVIDGAFSRLPGLSIAVYQRYSGLQPPAVGTRGPASHNVDERRLNGRSREGSQ